MISEHQDYNTGLVGLSKNYAGRDCDNHLLFTATAYIVFKAFPREQYLNLINQCRLKRGVFTRYPGDPQTTSWDDLLGLAVSDLDLANEIIFFGVFSDWKWQSDWLGRMPLFVCTLKGAAGVKLSLFSQVKAAACFISNLFEKKGETSGICLLYLAQRVLIDHGVLLNATIAFWRLILQRRYPRGIKEVYEIYFGPTHAFSLLAKEDFEV